MQDEKEILEQLVKDCDSYAEILRRLGKSNSGTALKLLKLKLDDYGIYHHFIKNKNRKISDKLNLDLILVNNKSFNSRHLLSRLIDAGIKEYKCENPECGISEWHGKKLPLLLHHINGNHNDNRLENLMILCPNCHVLTDNFGGKKLKSEQKVCLDCGKPITKNATYCRKCGPKHTNSLKNSKLNIKRPTKEQLIELLKSKSFCEIGRLYLVTDSSVRKWCKKFNLPYTKAGLKQYLFITN